MLYMSGKLQNKMANKKITKGGSERLNKNLPLHDEKQTLFSLVEIIKDICNFYNTWTGRCPAVKLYFSSCFRGVLQHLRVGEQEHTN